MLLVPLNILLVLTLFAETFPLASRTTTVTGLTATEVSYPSSKSAFRFATLVVEVTVSGAVPFAMFETSIDAVTVPVAFKFPTLALPVITELPVTVSTLLE